MAPGRGPRGPVPKISNPGKLLSRLMKFIFSRYLIHYVVVLICIFTSVFCSVQGTLFMQSLIDDYIEPMIGVANPDFGPLLGAMGRVAIFYAIGVVAAFVQQKVLIYVSQGSIRDMREELFNHMQDLPIRYFDTHAHGDIMSIYTNDIDTLRQMVSQSIPQMISSLITIVPVFINMCILSIPLTLLSVAVVVVSVIVSKHFAGYSSRYFLARQKDLGALNGFVEEMLSGQKVVKVFTHEDENIEAFNKLNEQLYDSSVNANFYSGCMGPINNNIGHIGYVLCTMLGAILALAGFGGFTLGKLASFLTFNKNFNQPINQVVQQMNSIIMALAGCERIFSLLDEEPETDEGYVTLVNVKEENGELVETEERTGRWAWRHPHQADGTVTYHELLGDVVFDGVDFGYVPEKIVLHDIKMFATPGQKIAFVGSTGAGKTTITNLINRFYDIQDGKIRYDGININKIKKADLRHSLGIVLQDTHLFTDTVANNIRYGKLDATEEEMIAAAKAVNAHDFIMKMEKGYDTELSERGAGLSIGQRQLIAFARTMISMPKILILDEATSSIDTHTERMVQEGIAALLKGRTSFVIAHRLSTIQNADRIFVVSDNGIIESGTPAELMALRGAYYRLYMAQVV